MTGCAADAASGPPSRRRRSGAAARRMGHCLRQSHHMGYAGNVNPSGRGDPSRVGVRLPVRARGRGACGGTSRAAAGPGDHARGMQASPTQQTSFASQTASRPQQSQSRSHSSPSGRQQTGSRLSPQEVSKQSAVLAQHSSALAQVACSSVQVVVVPVVVPVVLFVRRARFWLRCVSLRDCCLLR